MSQIIMIIAVAIILIVPSMESHGRLKSFHYFVIHDGWTH